MHTVLLAMAFASVAELNAALTQAQDDVRTGAPLPAAIACLAAIDETPQPSDPLFASRFQAASSYLRELRLARDALDAAARLEGADPAAASALLAGAGGLTDLHLKVLVGQRKAAIDAVLARKTAADAAEAARRAADEAEVAVVVKAAADAEAAKDWPRARERYEAIAAHPKATAAQREAARLKLQDFPGLLSRAWTAVNATLPGSTVVVFQVVFTMILVVAVLFAGRFAQRRLLRRSRRASFELLDERPGAAGAVAGQPPKADPALLAGFDATLREVSARISGGTGHDRACDYSEVLPAWGPGLGDDLREVSKLVDENASITVGLVKLPARALWNGLVELLFPARYAWSGVLRTEGDRTTFTLVRTDRAEARTTAWLARVPGTGAEALTPVLRRMVYAYLSTESAALRGTAADSLEAYDRALDLLAGLATAADRPATLKAARDALRGAAVEMPAARFRLAVVQRKLGERERARATLQALRADCPGDAERRYADYLEAVLDAQYRDVRHLQRAVRSLSRLAGPGGDPADTTWIYARSLLAATAAELLASDDTRESLDPDQARGLRELVYREAAFFASPPDGCDRRALAVARSFVAYAHGKVKRLQGDHQGALDAFQQAVQWAPPDGGDYVIAAQVALAKVHRERRRDGWFAEAQRELEEALAQDPANAAAHEEYGRALLDVRPARRDEAIVHLKAAATERPSAALLLGGLLGATDPAAGLAATWDAIRLWDGRAPLYACVQVGEIVASVAPQARTADHAAQLAQALDRVQARRSALERTAADPDPADRADADRERARLDRAIARLREIQGGTDGDDGPLPAS